MRSMMAGSLMENSTLTTGLKVGSVLYDIWVSKGKESESLDSSTALLTASTRVPGVLLDWQLENAKKKTLPELVDRSP